MDRRTFVKVAGTGAGLVGAASRGGALEPGTIGAPGKAPAQSRGLPDVIVVGAGSFGGWTALNLQMQGVKVRLIDAWGPGNSRSTSGDESRGVRSSYGDRRGDQAAQWGAWAKRAMGKWRDWDATWGREMKIQLYFTTGDLMMRGTNDAFIRNNRAMWDKIGAKYDVLTKQEVADRFPQFQIDDMEYFLYEPEAGMVRARRSCEAVVGVFKQFGGELQITRAWPTTQSGGKMAALQTSSGELLSAGKYLFACGPWLGKVFPTLLGPRMRTPMGSVYYFGAPAGENRMQHPNCPTFNYPGSTGWPALPDDNSGFRVRAGGGAQGTDPDITERIFSKEAMQRTVDFVNLRFPLLKNAPVLRSHSCHYESGSGGNFIVDKHPDMDNVWILGSGMSEGFKFGPVLGEYAANRMLCQDKEPELADSFRIPLQKYAVADQSGFGGPGGGGRGANAAGRGGRAGGRAAAPAGPPQPYSSREVSGTFGETSCS
ncbi:MAG: FAD-dependent oxidoreductase [Gemmatimonadetes bacterium]|nr:FAD-dependent oxidoreductase [Gemmatimonadota bacterium]